MAIRKDLRLDSNKTFSPVVMRTNLLLSSLYLSAFELLKSAIIEGIKDFFVFQDEISPEEERIMLETLQSDIVQRSKESYLRKVATYEKAVGIKITERDKVGLVPSCQWLQEQNVLSKDEVEDVKAIRDHRNEIAHELPLLLTGQGFDIKLEHFKKMRLLLHKIGVYWARNDMLVSLETLEEANLEEIPDEEVLSMRVVLLDLITDTIVDNLSNLDSSKGSVQSTQNE